MASTAGIAPATSTFARWRSDLAELRGQMASVIGLAPIRPGLKGRLLDLLCIHGLLAGSQEMVPEVGSATTSPPLQGGANLPQLLGVGCPARYRAAVFRLSAGGSAIELQDRESESRDAHSNVSR